MELMVIENDPNKALFFESCGVDRIFVDLEILGKEERQSHLNTVISRHDITDILKLKKTLRKAKVLTRINPINKNSYDEINQCIDSGTDVIMLPMFTTAKEVELFLKFTGGRVRTNLLLETPQAAMRIEEILNLNQINEIHIGLNDLSIALKLNFMLEMYLGNFLKSLCSTISSRNVSFGIGGIAPLNKGAVPGKFVLTEALSYGAERFILSRAFPKEDPAIFNHDLIELRKYHQQFDSLNSHQIKQNREDLQHLIINVRDS